ncbi:hypothetical protein AVEN_71095-1 [Araneus ventricosus]|uniref:Uncharacterized protein n=1 Tax=Araneus ventricosus TaxID=182803 RepID=A0A4Y2TWP9_ARAVE|nr:hypothetical protein AVEN_71095-1 [Araneus ventricosus]
MSSEHFVCKPTLGRVKITENACKEGWARQDPVALASTCQIRSVKTLSYLVTLECSILLSVCRPWMVSFKTRLCLSCRHQSITWPHLPHCRPYSNINVIPFQQLL